jgi:hypothetical protein
MLSTPPPAPFHDAKTGKHLSYSDAEDDEMSFAPEDLNHKTSNNFFSAALASRRPSRGIIPRARYLSFA